MSYWVKIKPLIEVTEGWLPKVKITKEIEWPVLGFPPNFSFPKSQSDPGWWINYTGVRLMNWRDPESKKETFYSRCNVYILITFLIYLLRANISRITSRTTSQSEVICTWSNKLPSQSNWCWTLYRDDRSLPGTNKDSTSTLIIVVREDENSTGLNLLFNIPSGMDFYPGLPYWSSPGVSGFRLRGISVPLNRKQFS